MKKFQWVLLLFIISKGLPILSFNRFEVQQRVRNSGNSNAIRAFEFLDRLNLLSEIKGEEKGFPYKGVSVTVNGDLSRFFNWNGPEKIRSELNKVGMNVIGTLNPGTELLILGENGSTAMIKQAVKLGIQLLDESQFYTIYKKWVVEDKSFSLSARLKKARGITLGLTKQLARDLYYHNGTFKIRLAEFLEEIKLSQHQENQERWIFRSELPLAGNEARWEIEIDKEDLKILNLQNW